MDHSEKQEVLRDVQNRVNRDELDVLERFGALSKEQIIKILVWEDEEDAGTTARIFIISREGYLYVYQLFKQLNHSKAGKVSLALEQLCTHNLNFKNL